MPERDGRHGHGHHGPWSGGGPPWMRGDRRPPWWPENEAFPPSAEARHRVRGGFRRRMAWGLAFFFGIMLAAASFALSVVSGAFGRERDHRLVLPTALLGIALLSVAAFVAVRAWRRTVRPMADVMDAADRVATGDYSVRVDDRGPREMRRLARSFNAMTERLGANESGRRDLFADLAHELRTPLSVIRGTVEGILDGVYPADRDHLEPVVDEATVMARLLEDLGTLSTAEAGALRLHREAVDPAALVEEAVGAFRGSAEAAGIRLSGTVLPATPEIDADPVRGVQVLTNLLANALRVTPAGGTVEVEARAGGGLVRFEVRDTGPGIPAERVPQIFERFVKTPDSGGAGLGLAIARALVEAHGGTIEAHSDGRSGTTIAFTLPAVAGS